LFNSAIWGNLVCEDQPKTPKAPMTCPICKKAPDAKYKPFCSRRCADVDLGKWLTEGYRIPSNEPADGEEAQETSDIRSSDTNHLLH
jgi:uncharacterized protein